MRTLIAAAIALSLFGGTAALAHDSYDGSARYERNYRQSQFGRTNGDRYYWGYSHRYYAPERDRWDRGYVRQDYRHSDYGRSGYRSYGGDHYRHSHDSDRD